MSASGCVRNFYPIQLKDVLQISFEMPTVFVSFSLSLSLSVVGRLHPFRLPMLFMSPHFKHYN
jgi:hypothetical protein